MSRRQQCVYFLVITFLLSGLRFTQAADLRLLFLGDNGHHRPADRAAQLVPVLARRGIQVKYTDDVAQALSADTLKKFDGLIVYANIDRIENDQAKALLDFVADGGGFIPLHCASYCFRNNDQVVALIGAQFQRHGAGVFRVQPSQAAATHPLMKGYGGFESWDETYVHTKHNEKDRTVLEYRFEGERREPWTWTRKHGKGRVFYTAWGHDQRTWGNPGFNNLIERGIRWAVGQDPGVVPPFSDSALRSAPFPIPEMTAKRTDVKPFEYVDVGKNIPNYTRGQRWGTQGELLSRMQKPLPAEESLKHMVTPRGFHVEVFATEKHFGGGKPICMTWDERGRLWLALTVDYPNEIQPAGKGRDRIVICEDTNSDDRADKVTVFAGQLSIPTTLAFHRGGVIVQNGAETLYLKDTDGDDQADERRVVFSGWNTRDTHGGVSNFQYGLDNWIWAMQGYNDSRPSVGGKQQQGFRQGFFRFRPDASELEFLRSTNNNTWGLGISEEGLVFGSTANRNPSVYMPIPNRYYESVRGWTPSLVLGSIAETHLFKPVTEKVRQVDQHGGFTAGAGHSLYTARHYPQAWWNRTAFVSGPTGHLVGTFVLRREGSNFRSSLPFNLVASDDEWAAPIMAEVGPDGNVWILDWYNYIIQHNPTPRGFTTGKGAAYESDLRDKKHGRIYRVVYDGEAAGREAPPNKKHISLEDATPQTLVATLKDGNLLWRRHAQRLLVERGNLDVLPDLLAIARDETVDEIGLNTGVIHALWTIHGLGALDGSHAAATDAAIAALRHKSAGVRRNAVQVLPQGAVSVEAILAAKTPGDPDPQVRLAALLALADQPTLPAVGAAVVAALSDPTSSSDRWIPDAATAAAANNAEHFLRALVAAKAAPRKLLDVAAVVAEHYARGGPTDSAGRLIASLSDAEPAVAAAIVRGMAAGWPDGKPLKINPQLEQDLEQLVERLAPERRGQIVRLAVSWGSRKFEKHAAEIAGLLLSRVEDESLATAQRLAAAREFSAYPVTGKAAVEKLLSVVTPRTPPELALGLLQAVALSDDPEAGGLILDRLSGLTPSTRSAGLAVLLNRPEWTRSLLEAADQRTVQLTELSLDQRQALARHPDTTIRNRARQLLRRGGALPDPDRQKVIDELLAVTKRTGDATAGQEVYKKHCSKCHTHSGKGAKIGPDLTGMAVHPKAQLLTELIDPSRSVESNYRSYTVVTEKGRVLTGMLASESRTTLELFDAEGKKQTVLREDIDELVSSRKSLMPDGFEKQVSADDIANLLEFLTQRGRFLPLPLDKVATIVSTRGMFYDENSRVERLVFSDWGPKTFQDVPFLLVDPRDDRTKNVLLLYGPQGRFPPMMPRSATLTCNMPVGAIHLLSGVSGWGHPLGQKGSVSLIVRVHYDDDTVEDHALKNGEHFADYIRRVEVPGSKFAFDLGGRQVRYLAVRPKRKTKVKRIELVKGSDNTAPVVMAVTLESP